MAESLQGPFAGAASPAMAALAGVALSFALYLGVPAVLKIWLRRRFLAKVRRSGCVCLTFDDGPDPRATPQILRLLREHGVKASFFMLGESVETHPELAREVLRQGHEIGEHSHAHSFAWLAGPLGTWRDLARGGNTLRKLEANARLLRPPYGKINLATLLYAALYRRKLAWWSVDPRDYAEAAPGETARRTISEAREGAVILLHDARRASASSPPEATVAALEAILKALKARRTRFATLSQALRGDSRR